MKHFKRILGIAVAFVIALALAACGPKKQQKVTVSFDSAGGSEVADMEVVQGEQIELPAAPERYGYDFDGWYLDEELEQKFADTQAIEEDITLHAKWNPVDVKVILDPDNGSEKINLVVKFGNPIVLTKEQQALLVKEKHVFGGFAGTDGKPFDLEAPVETVEDINIKATYLELFKLTIEANGGVFQGQDGKPFNPNEVEDYNTIVEAGDLSQVRELKPSKEKHTFAGWYLDAEFKEIAALAEVVVEGDMTIYAKWIPNMTITYSVPEGATEVKAAEVAKGSKARAPKAPTLPGMKFDAWYSDEALTTKFNFKETAIEADMTLYAKFVDLVIKVDARDGSAVVEATRTEEGLITKPADPTREGYKFEGWTADLETREVFDFTIKPTQTHDFTLSALWTSEKVVLKLKNGAADQEVTVNAEGKLGSVEDPQPKEGMKFAGWFRTNRGAYWLEPEAIDLNTFKVGETQELYAYYEPINSKTFNWSEQETYFNAMTQDTVLILNPLTFQWNHESAYLQDMSTSLYTSEVDWEKAIADGIASYPGDFSRIANKEVSINALDYHYIPLGAVGFPKDAEGDDHTIDGKYDRDNAIRFLSKTWTYEIRKDLKYEDGTPITARDYEYTLKQFLDKKQNNSRANMYYKTDDNKNGRPILNAFEYFSGEKEWEDVGFEVIDDYTFKVTFWESVSQSSAVGFGDMILVQQKAYEASKESEGKYSYGTPDHPFVSYGPYIIKSWDENSKLVFNKNFDAIGKTNVNYKSISYTIVADTAKRDELYKNGKLSVIGLHKDNYKALSETGNIFRSYSGYPHSLQINLTESRATAGKIEHPDILFDKKFRQALYYGFDRQTYATQHYQPNAASNLPMPYSAKQYPLDPVPYSESPQRLELLSELGINPDTYGFNADKAKKLFDEAYAEHMPNGGVVELTFLVSTDEFMKSLTAYVVETYENLFGKDKFKIKLLEREGEGLKNETQAGNFDIVMNNVGFGILESAYFQFPALSLSAHQIGGSYFGIFSPYDDHGVDVEGLGKVGDYYLAEIEVDLTNTLTYFEEIGEYEVVNREFGWLNEQLKAKEGKDAGIYKGSVRDLLENVVHAVGDPWSGTGLEEPFAGASYDLNNLSAALERVFLDYIPCIPLAERSDATIYADSVRIEWPEYSMVFGWGAARYRYLLTDPDFTHLKPAEPTPEP